jgi:hypothetical protein
MRAVFSILLVGFLASAPKPLLFSGLELDGLTAETGAKVERRLRDAFAKSPWVLQTPAEREADIARAVDAGVFAQGARLLVSCNASSMGTRVVLACRLYGIADPVMLGAEKATCGADLEACADELGKRVLSLVERAPR